MRPRTHKKLLFMKKVILFAAAIFMAATASAQKVSSTTYVKEKSQTMWYGRIGMSINNLAGAPSAEGVSMGSKIGMDVDFGFQRNISRSGLYWGMELGVGSRGASMENKYEDETEKTSVSAWNIKYSPITLGYKYSLTDDLKLDGHLGAFLSYDFTKKVKTDDYEWDNEDMDELDYNDFDAGMQMGAGIWYKRFNLDFTYQRGFAKVAKMGNKDLHSSNFMIRLGVAF